MREREAGIYNWDVYVGGTTSILEALMPAGAFAPLRPALQGAGSARRQGLVRRARCRLDGRTENLHPGLRVHHLARDDGQLGFRVARSSSKTFQDLLKPQFADKIVWDDPRLPGAGRRRGSDPARQFRRRIPDQTLSEQKIAYTSKPRQNAEWVVRGRYPIGIAPAFEQLDQFREQGLGKNITKFDGPLEDRR